MASSNILCKLLNIGVDPQLHPAEQQKIYLVNIYLAIVAFISLFYSILGLFIGFVDGSYISFTLFIACLFIWHKQHRRHYITARVAMIISTMLLYVSWTILFGDRFGLENMPMVFMAGILLTLDAKRHVLPLIGLCVVSFLSMKFIAEHYRPLHFFHLAEYFYYPNHILMFVTIYALINVFKTNQEKYRQEIEHKNGELAQQKEEIITQHDNLLALNEEVNLKNGELVKKNKTITDSINYARRIQAALLPSVGEMQQHLPDSFVFFQPRDIVSGDFYWFYRQEEKIFIAVADCTGHGVPGCLMSILGSNTLLQIVDEGKAANPAEMLAELDLRIRKQLKQDDEQSDLRDGMDIALCMLEGSQLYFAAAQRPLLLIRNRELIEIRGDKNPIGSGAYKDKTFTSHHLSLQPGDSVYLFSDGLIDQFDALNSRRYGSKRLKTFLLDLQELPIGNQREKLERELQQWKGATSQTDDMLMIGFRYSQSSTDL